MSRWAAGAPRIRPSRRRRERTRWGSSRWLAWMSTRDRERGAVMAEYAMLVAFVALTVLASVQVFGVEVLDLFDVDIPLPP